MNPPGILIGFVISPTWIFLSSFLILLDSELFFIQPISPPLIDELDILWTIAAFEKLLCFISFLIASYFLFNSFLLFTLKTISEIKNSSWVLFFEIYSLINFSSIIIFWEYFFEIIWFHISWIVIFFFISSIFMLFFINNLSRSW